MTDLQRISWVARAGLALIFFYHGLVPKILWLSETEIEMIHAHGIVQAQSLAWATGAGEILLAIWLVSGRGRLGSLILSAGLLIGLLADVVFIAPHLLVQAFNPVSVNGAGLALCAIVWLAERRATLSLQPENL